MKGGENASFGPQKYILLSDITRYYLKSGFERDMTTDNFHIFSESYDHFFSSSK